MSILLDRCNLLSTKITCISDLWVCLFVCFPDKANLEIKTKKLGGEKKSHDDWVVYAVAVDLQPLHYLPTIDFKQDKYIAFYFRASYKE